jgi:peptide-methionine (S)-S-oxide reductase
MQKATFGAGCFWHVEEAFRHMPGVAVTSVGFMGGTLANPTYRDVCTGKTGHAEVVEIIYDPSRISYDDLLKVFYEIHDPTSLNRQGPDIGEQYRSAIFYHDDEQKEKAEASKKAVERSGRFRKGVVTEVVPAGQFYLAEEYHQQYFEKRGLSSCKAN